MGSYAGIDWASEKHDVLIADEAGDRLLGETFVHDEPGIKARARGHNHRRALRTLGRAWSRIIWRCWQTRTPYDPARHTGLQQHITVTIPAAPRAGTPTTAPPITATA